MAIQWKYVLLFLYLPTLLVACLFRIVAAATPEVCPQVLILNSYHPGFIWSDRELTGLIQKLRRQYPQINPAIEYLDAIHFPAGWQVEQN